MSKNPEICLQCDEITTFCECDECITDEGEYISLLRTHNTALHKTIMELNKKIVSEWKEGYNSALSIEILNKARNGK